MGQRGRLREKDIQDKPAPPEERRWRSDELDAAEINDRRRTTAEGRPVE